MTGVQTCALPIYERSRRVVHDHTGRPEVGKLASLLDERVGLARPPRAEDEAGVERPTRGGDRRPRLAEVRHVVQRVVEPEDLDPVLGRGRDEAPDDVGADRAGADEEATPQSDPERRRDARLDRTDALPRALHPTAHEGVEDAAGAVEGFLPVSGLPGERLYVYGVDLLTDSAVRDHKFVGAEFDFDQALDFIAAPDSIALTESFSRRHNYPVGARITLLTSSGKKNFTVRALLREEGAASVFGGSFALMDLPVADRKSTRLNSSHMSESRMPSSA